MKPTRFDQKLASAVLEMSQEPALPATLDRVVALIVDLVESCDAAAVLLSEDQSRATVVASDQALQALVEEHLELESAPVWTAFTHQEPVYSADLSVDSRWTAFGEQMSQRLGLHSVYAFPLPRPDRQDQTLAVVVAYGKRIDGFDAEDQTTVGILATHATAALADAVHHQQLKTALNSRTVIGQATGIVMERFGLDAAQAFGVLRRLSQAENVKVRDIAARVVETRHVG